MARIRTIKPELFNHEGLADLPAFARLLFIGMLCHVDRRGRIEDRPRRIKAAVLPYDDIDVDLLLGQLHDAGFIIRYQVDGLRCIQIINFEKHQRISGTELKSDSVLPCYQQVMIADATRTQCGSTMEALGKHQERNMAATEMEMEMEMERNKTLLQHAGASEQLAEVVEERMPDLERLFPAADIPVVVEKLLHHHRSRERLVDPWPVVLRWFQREFPPVAAVPASSRASPGYADRWRDTAAREAEAFVYGGVDGKDGGQCGEQAPVLVGHGGVVQGTPASG